MCTEISLALVYISMSTWPFKRNKWDLTSWIGPCVCFLFNVSMASIAGKTGDWRLEITVNLYITIPYDKQVCNQGRTVNWVANPKEHALIDLEKDTDITNGAAIKGRLSGFLKGTICIPNWLQMLGFLTC